MKILPLNIISCSLLLAGMPRLETDRQNSLRGKGNITFTLPFDKEIVTWLDSSGKYRLTLDWAQPYYVYWLYVRLDKNSSNHKPIYYCEDGTWQISGPRASLTTKDSFTTTTPLPRSTMGIRIPVRPIPKENYLKVPAQEGPWKRIRFTYGKKGLDIKIGDAILHRIN